MTVADLRGRELSWVLNPRQARFDPSSQVSLVKTVQRDGSYQFAIRLRGFCWNRETQDYEYESPLPSSREDDFLRRCRYDTLDEAVADADAAVKRAGEPWT